MHKHEKDLSLMKKIDYLQIIQVVSTRNSNYLLFVCQNQNDLPEEHNNYE